MNEKNGSGMGVGSASIILVFAVLCLTVFSLITFVVAKNNKALVDTQAQLVVGYYTADAQADKIFAQFLTTKELIPSGIRDIDFKVEIVSGSDAIIWIDNENATNANDDLEVLEDYVTFTNGHTTSGAVRAIVAYQCPVTDEKELLVELAVGYDEITILSWTLQDKREWEYDGSLNIWLGE